MSRTVLVDVENDTLCIRFPGRTWEMAHDVISGLKESPPEGYRMIESQVKPREMYKSGRRCNVRLVFVRIDTRIEAFTTEGARAHFAPYMRQAQGVEE